MLQFYFLSILFNTATGLYLSFAEKIFDLIPSATESENHKKTNTVVLILGVLTALTGLVKLFAVVGTRRVIVGDFIPAVAGMAGGFALLLANYIERSEVEPKLPDWIRKVFITNQKILGYVCMAAAILHFVFGNVLFF